MISNILLFFFGVQKGNEGTQKKARYFQQDEKIHAEPAKMSGGC